MAGLKQLMKSSAMLVIAIASRCCFSPRLRVLLILSMPLVTLYSSVIASMFMIPIVA